MRQVFRWLKFTFVILVLMASVLRPIVVYAQNSRNNSVSVVPAHSHCAARCVLARQADLSKPMRVLDKEKVDAVCLTPHVQKELVLLEPRSFQKIDAVAVDFLSFHTSILRI